MKAVKIICLVLVIIGGINWGLVGIFDFNLVDKIFGVGSMLARTIYSLVGIASVLLAVIMTSMSMMEKDKPLNTMNR